MLLSRTSRLASFAVLIGLATCLTGTANASVTERYASPTGSGTACTSAAPCDVATAIELADQGDDVVLGPGQYGVYNTIDDPAQITIHGVQGQQPPRLTFVGGLLRLSHGSDLRDVQLLQDQPKYTALMVSYANIDQVTIYGGGDEDCALQMYDSYVTDSVVIGGHGAICTGADSSFNTSSIRNVTAVSTAPGSTAISVDSTGPSAIASIFLVNDIAKAGTNGVSLEASTDGSGAQTTVSVSHTNYANSFTYGSGAQFVDDGGNQGTPPHFVDPTTRNFHEAPGSVTIDAGTDSANNGTHDVDGDQRAIGTTDIGADEFLARPRATTGAANSVTDHSATLNGNVNPDGLATSYHFEYGTTTAYGGTSPTVTGGSGTTAVGASRAVSGLKPATTYHFRLVAKNAGGVVHGADHAFKTAAASPPPPPPPPTAFAGVGLVSSALSFHHRTIRVRLRCPAAKAAGACSGQTKLTVRRRLASGTRVIVLGGAKFSIPAGKQATVKVTVSRAGRRLLKHVSRVHGRDSNATRNGTGQSKKTTYAVTIRRR